MTPEERKAALDWLADASDVLNGTGAHATHEQRQVGRCVVCSCNARVQGRMTKK